MALTKATQVPSHSVTGEARGHVSDKLNYVTPEEFGAYPDGTNCGEQLFNAWLYVAQNGGELRLSKGTYFVGTTRFHFTYSDNIQPHRVVGQGDSTIIKFGDIPPSGLQAGQDWVKEEPLVHYLGNSGTQFIPKVELLNFRIDYSDQSNKGGTSLDSLDVTHPTPYSLGVWAVYMFYALQPTVCGLTFSNIYGDGVVLRKSTMPTVRDCRFDDVSAGNIISRVTPNMSSDSNGGCVFLWSCHGGLVENNICWNTRTYKASVVSLDNGTQIKDTLCGYIGIWSEYEYDKNMPEETAPPKLSYISQGNVADNWNKEALGCVIRNNTVYGYTLGIKTEGFNEAHIKDNVVLNTYLPILAANTRSLIEGNWTDMLYCDNRTCPQGGFQSIRSSITAHNFISTFDGARCGVTLRDNKCFCVNYAGFRANRVGTLIEGNMFRFARGAAWPFDVNLSSKIDGVIIRDNLFFFDATIGSATTANLQYHSGTQFTGNRFINRSDKQVTLAFRNNCDGLNLEGNTFDGKVFVAMQGQGSVLNNMFIDSSGYKGIRFQATASCTVKGNTFRYELGSAEDNVSLQADNIVFSENVIDAQGAGSTKSGALVSAPGSNKGLVFTDNITVGNAGALPMLNLFGAHYPIIDRNKHTGGALLKTGGNLYAPITIGYNVTPSLFVEEPRSELNVRGNISPSFTPYRGMRMYYLKPENGGKEGLVYTGSDWKGFGSIDA